MASDVDLSGLWRAAPGDDQARPAHLDPSFDDSGWAAVAIPGHWASHPDLAGSEGPILHRRPFVTPEPFGPGHDETDGADRRTWLVLDGVFSNSDVWLDGSYVGETEGYFFPHAFEVTDQLRASGEHLLGIDVACPRSHDPSAKRSITGEFGQSDLLDRDLAPGGIWRPVRLEQTGPVRIRHSRLRCTEVTDESAALALRAVLDTVESCTVELVTTVTLRGAGTALVDRYLQPLAAGENRVEWPVAIPDPQRWWPHALGAQPRYDVRVEVRTESGALSDERTRTTGLRTVEVHDWIFSVNGERIFLKGANQGPNRALLAEAPPESFARDVDLARRAGLDFLRLHAHITRPELYEAADEAGMLLWQDLPLQWGYSRSVRPQARRQAREAVDLLAHHPSVFLWCGHNEPVPVEAQPDDGRGVGRRSRRALRRAAGQALPSWNRSLLDRAVKTVLESDDGTRPVVAHSGVMPHLPQLDGTDSHLYLGWYSGVPDDLAILLGRWPRLGRFVSEFGAQAVPDSDGFVGAGTWPDLDWGRLARHHCLQVGVMARVVPPDAFLTYEDWKAATQRYQADLIRNQIETLRRLKYRPTGGFALFCFADAGPAISWSVLDHERVPKAGFDALTAACRPVIVVAQQPPDHVHAGERFLLEVHAISDDRVDHAGLTVRATATATGPGTEPGPERTWTWEGDLPADSCIRIGVIDVAAPDLGGPLTIDLVLEGDGLRATNRYTTTVVTDPHDH